MYFHGSCAIIKSEVRTGRGDPDESSRHALRYIELAIEKGIRDKVIIAAGGTQVVPEEARNIGLDEGFGRDSHGIDVATFLAEEAMRRRGELKPGEHKE